MKIVLALSLFIAAAAAFINPNPPCGNPDIGPVVPFVVGGSKAKKGSWPWQANLRMPSESNPTGFSQFCGGTFIKNQWVITAAHCWNWIKDKPLSDYRIGLGYYHVDGLGDEAVSATISPSNVFIHEGYDRSTIANDIALLKLSNPMWTSEYISPACLPTTPIQDAGCVEIPVVTGWGNTEGTAAEPDYLQQAHVPYIDTATCNQRNWYDGESDSGGPVVCREQDGLYHVHGITNWGYGCAEPRSPGVYIRVNYYIDWINNIINNNS